VNLMVALISSVNREPKSKEQRSLSQERPMFFGVKPRAKSRPEEQAYPLFTARWWPGDGHSLPAERQDDV
jgi:hypothetical protein